MIAADLAYRLKNEGCNVKLFIEDESRKDCFENMVEKTDDWRKELDWVGKDGLIVFDDVGYGKTQDDLRSQGYQVAGGSEGGDRLEKDREFGQKIMAKCGIESLETFNFLEIDDAIDFVRQNKNAWVLKQNGHASALNYVGEMPDGSDVLEVLKCYRSNKLSIKSLSLQKKVNGVEIAAGRYFNGTNWAGPVEINVEHKRLFNGDIGPFTGEMGTVASCQQDDNELFKKTLAKLKPYLQKNNFKGDIDINCIVNEENVYPLEITARFGCPSTHLHQEIHLSPWSDFLMALAKGKNYDLEYKNGYGIVVSVSIPPFPYKSVRNEYLKGTGIFFSDAIKKIYWNNIHFEEVSLNKTDGENKYCVSGSNGYILYVTGFGKTIIEAREQVYGLIKQILVPKMFYRTDIGLDFAKKHELQLKKWGWL